MKNKLLMNVLMFLLLVGIAFGATFISPTSSTVLREGIIINVSAVNATNCTLTLSSSNAGTTDTIVLINESNDGITGQFVNGTYNTSRRADSNDYQLSGTCTNSTWGNQTITTITSLTIDNTVPEISTVTPANDSSDTDGTVVFNATCTNATSAVLLINGVPQSMTESSDICTLTVKAVQMGLTTWTIRASDGTNETTSSQHKVNVRRSSGGIVQGQNNGGVPIANRTPKAFVDMIINGIRNVINQIISVLKR